MALRTAKPGARGSTPHPTSSPGKLGRQADAAQSLSMCERYTQPNRAALFGCGLLEYPSQRLSLAGQALAAGDALQAFLWAADGKAPTYISVIAPALKGEPPCCADG